MNLTKASIAKEISKNTSINFIDSKMLLDSFINAIKSNSTTKKVKISNFGTFKYISTPKRIGRNPKTKETHIISKSQKLSFLSSNYLRKALN